MLSTHLFTAISVAGHMIAAGVADSTHIAPSVDSTLLAPSIVARASALTAVTRTESELPPGSVEYSEWYGRRLVIHRIGSYVMLPLFAGEYVLGNKLLSQREGLVAGTDYVHDDTRRAHQVTAGAVAGLFAINTVTGLWNLYDARTDDAGRGKRTLHAVIMLAADAGFTATGVLASQASSRAVTDGDFVSAARTHRNVALASMGVATVGTAIMWFNRD